MRYLCFALLALFAGRTLAQQPTYDQKLALAVAHAYVESYLRLHPQALPTDLNWEQPQIRFVPRSVGTSSGYIGVFFPDRHGPGAGHAYFDWTAATPGHLLVFNWGVSESLTRDMTSFVQAAANGTLTKTGVRAYSY